MLRNNFIAVIVGISTMSFVVLTIISVHAFAKNDCSAQDNVACAQSDLSLPVPSENDIEVRGLQQQPEDQSGASGQGDESEDNDGSTFLLPFP
ncbi:MAG: hypothetical protein WBX01_08480 [Nitrososphaeraceae archaeon]